MARSASDKGQARAIAQRGFTTPPGQAKAGRDYGSPGQGTSGGVRNPAMSANDVFDDDRISPSAATSEMALAKLCGGSPATQIRQAKGQALTYTTGDHGPIVELENETGFAEEGIPITKPAGGSW